MSIVRRSGDCLTINPNTYGYDFVRQLREKHKENGNYELIEFEEIVSSLSNRLKTLLRQDEDCQLLQLLKHNIVSTNPDYTHFAIHPTHQKDF